jgi:carboxymethylenebutenolidase
MGEYHQIQAEDGNSFRVYVDGAADGPMPAIVVLPEVFGINDDMRTSCRELAERGYLAICPELFWRLQPGIELNHRVEADFQQALGFYMKYDRDQGVRDIASAIDWARGHPRSNGKVGLMGYCLGGLMTFLTTARTGTDASVVYYPGEAEKYVGEAPSVQSPMIVHIAGEDEFMPKAAQQAVEQAFAGNPNVDVFIYPGCNHAFARHSGLHFDATAAALANGRTWDFFQQQLAPVSAE